MIVRLLDERVDDGETGADWRVEGDDIEGAVGDGREAVALEGFGIRDLIASDILAGEFNRALIDIDQGDMTLAC